MNPPNVILQTNFCLNTLMPEVPPTGSHHPVSAGPQSHGPHGVAQGKLGLEDRVVRALQDVVTQMHQQQPTLVPNPVVAAVCVSHKETVGIWFDAPAGLDPSSELSGLDIIPGGDVWAIQITAATLQGFVDQLPARLNQAGAPDPKGDVELLSRQVVLVDPNIVQLQITGVLHAGIDQNFSATISDTLTVDPQGVPACTTTVSVTRAWWAVALDSVLAQLTGGMIGNIGEEIFAGGKQTDVAGQLKSNGGIGCAVLPLFPTSVLIPGGQKKAVFKYTDMEASAAGITGAGVGIQITSRSPQVTCSTDPIDFWVGQDDTGYYYDLTLTASTKDLRSPLTATWSELEGFGNRAGIIPTVVFDPPDQLTTKVHLHWKYDGVTKPGDWLFAGFWLSVVDADGTTGHWFTFEHFQIPIG